ncbi:hypothetical protein MIDIC_20067 [Alphaproteobacteria bacterium]
MIVLGIIDYNIYINPLYIINISKKVIMLDHEKNVLDLFRNKTQAKLQSIGAEEDYDILGAFPAVVAGKAAKYAKGEEQMWNSAPGVTKETRIAIRGDNNCSKRSLIYGYLIQAATLVKSGKAEDGGKLLDKLSAEMNDFEKFNCPNAALNEMVGDFQKQNYASQKNEIQLLIEKIRNGSVGVAELVYLANHDCNATLSAPDPLNLGLAALASFIMLKGMSQSIAGVVGEAAIGSDNFMQNYEMIAQNKTSNTLSLSKSSSSSSERNAFCAQLGVNFKDHTLFGGKYNVITFPDKEMPNTPTLICSTKTGHTNLVINEMQHGILQEEVQGWTKDDTPDSLKRDFATLPLAKNGPFDRLISTQGRERTALIKILTDCITANEFQTGDKAEMLKYGNQQLVTDINALMPGDISGSFKLFVSDVQRELEERNGPHGKFEMVFGYVVKALLGLCHKIAEVFHHNREADGVKQSIVSGLADFKEHVLDNLKASNISNKLQYEDVSKFVNMLQNQRGQGASGDKKRQ